MEADLAEADLAEAAGLTEDTEAMADLARPTEDFCVAVCPYWA